MPAGHFFSGGGLNGVYQIVGELIKPIKMKVLEKAQIDIGSKEYQIVQIASTFFLIDFSWIFFRSQSCGDALKIIRQMFRIFNPWIFFDGSIYTLGLNAEEFLIAVLAILILLSVSVLHSKGVHLRRWVGNQKLFVRWTIYYGAIFMILIWGIYGQGYEQTQFIYFQF